MIYKIFHRKIKIEENKSYSSTMHWLIYYQYILSILGIESIFFNIYFFNIHYFLVLADVIVLYMFLLFEWRNFLPFAGVWVHPRFLSGYVLLFFLVFCVVLCVFFAFPLCAVSSVPNVTSVSGLSILDCPFNVYFDHIYHGLFQTYT